jgi:hypothetical protein
MYIYVLSTYCVILFYKNYRYNLQSGQEIADRFYNWLTDFMEQSPLWEADKHSASQETFRLVELEVPLPCSQEPATDPCPESVALCPKLST